MEDDEDSILDGVFGGALLGGLFFGAPIIGGLLGGLFDSFDE